MYARPRSLFNLNPFKGIIGPKHARNAPTLNSSYGQNISKTLRVLNGTMPFNFSDDGLFKSISKLMIQPKLRQGLLDIIPFAFLDVAIFATKEYITRPLTRLYLVLPTAVKIPATLLLIPLILTTLALNIAQLALRVVTFALSAAVTVAAAAVILPVLNFISGLVWKSKINTASNIPVEGFTPDQVKNNLLADKVAVGFRSSTNVIYANVGGTESDKVELNTALNANSQSTATEKGLQALMSLDWRTYRGGAGIASEIEETQQRRYLAL